MTFLLSMHKPATANNRYRGLQQWFRWMVNEDEIEYSPFAKLSPPIVPEEPVPVVPIEDIRAVLATCKIRTFVNLRDEAIIRLFCDTGVRVSEMAGLLKETDGDQRVPHVDLEQRMIWVLGKGRRFRGLPFVLKTGGVGSIGKCASGASTSSRGGLSCGWARICTVFCRRWY